MLMIIRKSLIAFFAIILLISALPAKASEIINNSIDAYFFSGDGCPHCAQEAKFLYGTLKKENPSLIIHEFEIYNNRNNTLILQKVSEKLGVRVDGVPFLVIGDQTFTGYAEGITPEDIRKRVAQCYSDGCVDSISEIVGISAQENIKTEEKKPDQSETAISDTKEQKIIKLPFIGEINALSFSLPILTIIMGALDGFNPCAMWTLLFLISLLIGMENKKRMWILGVAFIITSASVYFLFMSAWLNLVLFLGFVVWTRILIGLIALIGGGYSLKEYLTNKDSGCKVTNSEKRRTVFEKMKTAVQQHNLWLALGGIIVLAFAVNLVELVCSAGLPAIYTQILALNDIPPFSRYLYILGYILFFMLDDLIIFFAAMFTLESTGITTKYARTSRLIGGIIMLAIGLMLIFKPEWLMFG